MICNASLVFNETELSQKALEVVRKVCAEHKVPLKEKDASPDAEDNRPEWSKTWYSFPRLILKHGEQPQLVLIEAECSDEAHVMRSVAALVAAAPESAIIEDELTKF